MGAGCGVGAEPPEEAGGVDELPPEAEAPPDVEGAGLCFFGFVAVV